MDLEKFTDRAKGFVQAARRCKEAGFDGVEVWAAYHGFVDQFWTPSSNRRDDRWGGSLENRVRFGAEIMRRIRRLAGEDFILGLAISLAPGIEASLSVEQMQEIVAWHDERMPVDGAAELLGHGLLTVANAEDRNACGEDRHRRGRRVVVEHGRRPAGQNDGLRLHLVECGLGLLKRHDLGIDADFAHAARDQLRHLTAEIDDQNLFMRRGRWRRRLLCFLWGCHGKQIRDRAPCRNRARAAAHMLLQACRPRRPAFPRSPMDFPYR